MEKNHTQIFFHFICIDFHPEMCILLMWICAQQSFSWRSRVSQEQSLQIAYIDTLFNRFTSPLCCKKHFSPFKETSSKAVLSCSSYTFFINIIVIFIRSRDKTGLVNQEVLILKNCTFLAFCHFKESISNTYMQKFYKFLNSLCCKF